VLRLWDCDKWEMTKQFTGGHTKSIVKVIGYEVDGNEYLLSASVDGVVCQWNVKTGNLIIQSFGKVRLFTRKYFFVQLLINYRFITMPYKTCPAHLLAIYCQLPRTKL
jgi:hypothetical protein